MEACVSAVVPLVGTKIGGGVDDPDGRVLPAGLANTTEGELLNAADLLKELLDVVHGPPLPEDLALEEDVGYVVTDWMHLYVEEQVEYARYSCNQCHLDRTLDQSSRCRNG